MAKMRYINTRFWNDAYISDLDPSEKLLFLYCLTNPTTNISGAYEIPLKIICADTGFDKEMILKLFKRFENDDKIIYRDGWVVVLNFITHQNTKSKDIISGIERELKNAPEWLQGMVMGRSRDGGIYLNLNLNLNLKPLPTPLSKIETPELKAFRIHYDSFNVATAIPYKQPKDEKYILLLDILKNNSFDEVQYRLDYYFKYIDTDKHNVNHFVSMWKKCTAQKEVIDNLPAHMKNNFGEKQ